jgi:hypothetical protein
MDQRRLRLGDILDDYCPRERRVTNHAVVAMIEEDVKQTRCTTCDAEHVYKGGKAPRRKKSETTGALYKEVLAGITDDLVPPAPTLHVPPAESSDDPHDADTQPAPEPEPTAAAADEQPEDAQASVEDDAPQPADDVPADEGPVHRPLIRAQLPRPEGAKIERQAPDFTIRHNAGRGGNGNFRGGDMRGRSGRGGHSGGGHGGGGHRFGRGPNRGGEFGRGQRHGGNAPRKRGR